MTNQLFRDYLDGKINVQRTVKFADPQCLMVQYAAHMDIHLTPWQVEFLERWFGDPPPADRRAHARVRAHALRVRYNRNTGPKPANLNERGRVTRYQTKG